MGNEINRLNQEIESLKRKQTVQEEALVKEWREKMKSRERQFEEELADLEEKHRSFFFSLGISLPLWLEHNSVFWPLNFNF